jgi:hypothetical protein
MARQTPCVWLLRARSRVSEVRLVAPTGVAADDASDRLLHSETVPTRALVLRRFPAQRPSPCDAFRRRPRTALVPEPRGSVPVHANVCSSRATSHVRRRAAQAPGGSGPPDTNEAGEIRASRREPHFGDRTILTRRRFLPPCEIKRPGTSDTPVASSDPSPMFAFLRTRVRGFGGRQDRFCGGLVKGVRFADPGCLLPVDASTHPARAEAQTRPSCLHRRRGAHVMRIAEL